MKLNMDAFELDQLGRARLSDEDLTLLDELGQIAMSGGDGINDACPSTTNGSCVNAAKCELSSNTVQCFNQGSCDNTRNGPKCYNTPPHDMETVPE